MAGRGPSPKSLAAQREAARKRAPSVALDVDPDPPGDLNERGRELWLAAFAAVDPEWFLDERDQALLERACQLADMESKLEAAITEHGVMTTGSTGQLAVSPAVGELRQTRAAIARLLGQIEIAPPKATTRHLNGRQRNVLRDLRVIN